mmetsp:Transcript_5307/g.17419  ORF Transcript_5307/g.17419 Transcript_5307/m.17419 type:complete len:530 (-) Transcript_5307:8-1597(-)
MKEVNGVNLFRSWLFPSLGGLLYGYDIGSMAMVLRSFQGENKNTEMRWSVAGMPTLAGVIVAMTTWGAMVGSLFVFYTEARLGRRREMLVSACCYLTGASIQASAGTEWSLASAVTWICVGRFVYGVGVGFAMHGVPSYIAETAPASLRGALVSGKEAMIVFGMLLGYAVGAWVEWRVAFFVAAPLSVVYGVGVSTLPPSPRWLALRRAPRKAVAEAAKFVSGVDADQLIMTTVTASDDGGSESPSFSRAWSRLTSSTSSRAALKVGLGLVAFQQITGQPSVLYYADEIFTKIGLGNAAVIGVAAWKLAATLCAVAFADSYGRKTLLYVGCSLMAVALLALALVVGGGEKNTSSSSSSVVLVAMFVYIGGYQVGYGPVVWLYVSEIFPLAVRGQALSVAVFANFALNAIITLACSPLLAWSPSLTFAVFFGLVGASLLFTKTQVPETKGLSLEAITSLLEEASRGDSNNRKKKHDRAGEQRADDRASSSEESTLLAKKKKKNTRNHQTPDHGADDDDDDDELGDDEIAL